MDFRRLTRRQLQALCKKNKIPANITNVAMADALASLETIEGIEEFQNPCESETANSSMVSPEKSEKVSGSVPRTLTRTRGRTRGKTASDVDETKIEMVETPAKPTTRRRAAATSVRPKLENSMKEYESKEHIGDQIEMEKKEAPKTPAAVYASRRREVKPKSSVRPVYSTRRSARLAVKTNSESSRQEKETLEAITYDSFSEAVDENLEVDSKQCSIHKNEELDKNGIDLKASKASLDTNKDSVMVSGEDSNILAENQIEVDVGVQEASADGIAVDVLNKEAEKGLDVEESYHSYHVVDAFYFEHENKTEAMNEVNGNKQIEGSFVKEVNDREEPEDEDIQNKSQDLGHDAKTRPDFPNVALSKQLIQENEVHCDETFDLEENNVDEEDQNDENFECEMDDVTESNSNGAEGELVAQMKEEGDNDAEEDHSDEESNDFEENNVAEEDHNDEIFECEVDGEEEELMGQKEEKEDYVAEEDSDGENNVAEEDHNDEIFEYEVDGGTESDSDGAGEEELMGQKKGNRDNVAEEDSDEDNDFEENNVVEEDHNDEFFESEVDDGTESNSEEAGELDVSEANKELTREKKDKGVDLAVEDSDEENNVFEENNDAEEDQNDEIIFECEVDDGTEYSEGEDSDEENNVFEENNDAEEDQNDEIIFECEMDDGTEYSEGAGGELMGQKKEKGDDVAEEDDSDEFLESEIDDGTKSNSVRAGELDVPGANIELTGEKLMDKSEVVYDEANVDGTAKVEFAEGEEPIEKLEISAAKAGLDAAAHLPVASPMPNAASKSVSTSPSSSRTAKPFLIIEKSCLTPVKISSSKTPMKKSMSKTLVATKIDQMHVSDDKENIDISGRKLVLTKEKLKKNRSNADNNSKQSLNGLSLRQLTKMLKDLQISKDPNKKDTTNTKAASSRPALQTLPENRLMS